MEVVKVTGRAPESVKDLCENYTLPVVFCAPFVFKVVNTYLVFPMKDGKRTE